MKLFHWFRGHQVESTIRWVGQEEGKGCAVACVAMVLSLSYWNARALFPHFDPEAGVLPLDAIRVLGEYGWASVEKFPHYSPEKVDRRRWPLSPFAPVHLVQVISTGCHAVLLLEDGTVLDPLYNRERALHQYKRVLSITGLWRVA